MESLANPTCCSWKRFFVALLMATFLPLLAFRANGQDEQHQQPSSPADIAAARKAAEEVLAGREGARDRLVAMGPAVFPQIRDLFEAEGGNEVLNALARLIARSALEQSLRDEPDLRYHGQFDQLEALGEEGANALFEIFADEDASLALRNRAASAMGDVGSVRLLPELSKLARDFLTEPWVEREAGYIMARLGDRTLVDRWIEKNRTILAETPTTANLPALIAGNTELAEIYYRIGDYRGAVDSYRRKLALLEDLRNRVRPDLRAAVTDETVLLQYNLACSLSLSGDQDEAFDSLEAALPHPEITLEMVSGDGDLRALRKTERFAAWFATMRERYGAASGPGGAKK